ncbi:unnamed protein product [Arabis nemorensis]|uniref:Uncharacterized protein n=1 Tax=Arabis nemorensis TaxID=586526 RepID=A0A565BST3_9BRAS|nr:unnamed protein product [Arabis nemorensis]
MTEIFSYAWNSNAGPSKSNTLNQNMVALRPKKRKGSIFLQSPWHKVYLQDSELCHSISISEQEWTLATNTLCEEVDPNEVISPSKRRLVVSINLMRQLLQPAPPLVFSGNNTCFSYEIMLYFVPRIALGDACSLKCHSDLDKSTKRPTSKTASYQDQHIFSLVKAFMEKMQKLESDFQSRERSTTSIFDIILEIEDLERFSVINRLAKFHSRAKTVTRSVPQRCVVEIQMPKNLPEPLHCLPL